MADITQAAKWMNDGHKVLSDRRRNGIYAQEGTGHFFTASGGVRTVIDLDDLLDDTWEVAHD